MYTEFTNAGVRYKLVATVRGRRDSEVKLEDIRPDLRLWTSAQKRRALAHRDDSPPLRKKGHRKGKGILLPGSPPLEGCTYATY